MRIEVEPDVLVQSGQKMGSIGSQLGVLAKALGTALGNGIASGIDPAGANFGIKYGHQAQDFAKGMANATDAHNAVGFMLQATGYNYENADAASTIGGAGSAGSVGAPPDESPVADAKGVNGVMVPPPTKWALIQTFLGPMWSWPSGNASMMRITAAQWRNFANGLAAFDGDMSTLKGAVSQQHIPEAGKIGDAITDLTEGVKNLAESATGMAKAIEDFASGVQDTQDAIRDLMDRISLDGLWDTVTGFLTGDGDDILREVAEDVKQLLENFQSQVKGVVGLLGELTTLLGSAADSFQKWVRPILVEALGDDVGNAAADYVTWNTDVGVGVVTGLINTVSGVVSLADLDTWKGMAEVAQSVVEDPTKLPGVLENMGKEFVAWDKWSGDHPGRAAGEAAFNIGTLFVPGGALAKGGGVAKSLSYASRLFEEGRLPRISDLPGLGGGRSLPSVDNPLGAGLGHPGAPEFTPPRVPESLVNPPSAPHAPEAPRIPQEVGSSGAPPGGGPPDPPGGRAVGPPDTGPGRLDGTASQSPSSGAGEPPRPSEPTPPSPLHAPSSGDERAPAAPHAPESPSSAGPHETGGQSPSEPGPSPTEHPPATPEQHGNGVAEPRADGNHAPDESHQPSSEGHNGGTADGTPAPAHHQPAANTPTTESLGTHESPGTSESARTDNGQPHEPTHEPGDAADARPHEPAATTPATPMAGGMPMAPHAGGGVHSPSDGPASRAPSPESPTRTPESKAPQSGSPETPRTTAPASAGPGPSSTPSAPVNAPSSHTPTAPVSPAATQHLSPASETPRPGPESSAPKSGDGMRDGSPPSHDAPSAPAAHQPDPPGSHPNPGAGNTPNQPPNPPGPVGNPAEARAFGPGELAPVEQPAFQRAVEDALRDHQGNYITHADPRTNDYGHLVNDGGPSVPGRGNNCLDSSLSALSSFRGDPTVSAPRHPDKLPDGTVDRRSGEQGGLRRAENWLGGGLLEFTHIPAHTFSNPTIADHFKALHRYIESLGSGSSALVVNGWHARDIHTGERLYHPDGTPVTDGSHATAIVYPEGASHPVWWDPQQSLTSDHPPTWMVDESSYLNFTPIEPSGGMHHGGTGNQRTSAGISGADVPHRDIPGSTDPERMGGNESLEPRTDGDEPGGGTGPSGDRFGDGDRVSVPQLVGEDGGGRLHDVQADGGQPSRKPDLSVPVDNHDSAHPGGRPDDHVSADGGVTDRSLGTDSTSPTHDREKYVGNGSDGLAVERGDVPRGVDEPPEPGSVADGGHDSGVGEHEPDRPSGNDRGDDELPATDHSPDDEHEGHGAGSNYSDGHHQTDDRPADRYVQLADGTDHRVWASNDQLRAQASRFEAADAWLSERGLTRADVQPLLVQPADWLNGAQRDLLYGFRHEFPDVANGEGIQKITDTKQAESRLAGGSPRFPPNETGGSVSVGRDTHHLDNSQSVYDGLGLEYEDTPFDPNEPVVAMRFTVDDNTQIHLPDQQLSRLAGHGDSYDPGYPYPFTGTGFTASDHFTVPEYFLDAKTKMNPGAEMYKINPDGSEELIAVLGTRQDWIRVVTP